MFTGARFQEFLEGWIVRQEHYLDELISVEQHCHESSHEDLKDLTNRILAHYEQYYEEKSRISQINIFLVFSSPWFTHFERSFLWIAGFKPGLALQVLQGSVHDLSEYQRRSINRLMEETQATERMLRDELARVQESVAAPPMLNLARRQRPVGEDGEVSENRVTGALASGMETVVARADLLRTNTVTKLMEILNPVQSVKFFRAAAQLQLSTRNIGLQRQRLLD